MTKVSKIQIPDSKTYQTIYEIVRQIPPGRVTSYGQIARLLDRCTPRMVGFAMASLPEGNDVPWHRVLNHQGRVSVRAHGAPDPGQRALLEAEGVGFDRKGCVDFETVGWLQDV